MKWFLFINFLALELIASTSGSRPCPPNQEYLECGTCEQICDQEPRGCSAVCKTPGCYCKQGYMKAYPCNSSECVLPSNCPGQCSVNEEYNSCGGCDQICNEEPIFCTQSCDSPGCYCKKGYVRAFRGHSKCIPESSCQRQQCKVNEVFKYCGGCNQYCNEEPVFCPAVCRPGCYCRDGYKKSFRGGICIPISACQNKCGQNEVYKACGRCDPVCGKNSGWCQQITEGPQICTPGCYCKDGLVRVAHTKGSKCIKPEQCPGQNKCRQNEVYKACGGCDQVCGKNSARCLQIIEGSPNCRPGCYCKDGLVRASDTKGSKCIKAEQCQGEKQQCRVNEVYKYCNGCDQYCNEGPVFCKSFICRPGCYCQEGYKRSFRGGLCIPKFICPYVQIIGLYLTQNTGQIKCRENEVYKKCGGCDQVCGRNPALCAQSTVGPQNCIPGCYCKDGLVRADDTKGSICIKKQQCQGQQQQCSANEVYKYCGGCDQYCNEGRISCAAVCSPGCYCKKGYKRSFRGSICIPISKCPVSKGQNSSSIQSTGQPKKCKLNEVYIECGGCDKYCFAGPTSCPECLPGCYCRDGYKRLDGNCVPASSCQPKKCKVNEVFIYCGGCDSYCFGGPIACAVCLPDCYCRDGYKRLDGNCVPASSCQKQKCGVNEVYKSCGGCDQYCNRGPVSCTADCRPGCACKDGYKRSYEGDICIPETSCQQQQCSANEVYKYCGGCDQYCNEDPIACAAVCKPGCFCQDGYKRSFRGGICIPIWNCPDNQDIGLIEIQGTGESFDYWSEVESSNSGPGNQDIGLIEIQETGESFDYRSEVESSNSGYACGENEVYDQCGVGKQCEDYCFRGSNACSYCMPGCYCNRGYIREGPGSNAKCIREAQCKRDVDASPSFSQGPGYNCRPDEVFNICGVGPKCENYCGRGANACAYCKPACYCKEGTIRAGVSNRTRCISDQRCPVEPKCFDKNEEYSHCGTKCPANCENKNPICTQNCVAGCFCKKGYIRQYADVQAKRYECIPLSQCPS